MSRLTLKDAAGKLGLSTKTLRRRIKEGKVFASLEDGWYYLDTVEVDRLLSTSRGVDAGEAAGQAPGVGVQAQEPGKPRAQAKKTALITLDKIEYDSLIYKLATLESELGQARKLLEAPAKVGWWRRFWGG